MFVCRNYSRIVTQRLMCADHMFYFKVISAHSSPSRFYARSIRPINSIQVGVGGSTGASQMLLSVKRRRRSGEAALR